MRAKLFTLAIALAFLGAPVQGALAAEGCPPCCPRPADAPCESGETPCASLAAASCCAASPAAPAGPGQSLERSGVQLAALPARAAPPPGPDVSPLRVRQSALRAPSPLRLSVVLIL